MPGRRSVAGRVAVAAALASIAAGPARANFTGQVEPRYGRSVTESTDQAGLTTRRTADAFVQRYRLNWDRRITPLLRFAAGTIVEDTRTWTLEPVGDFSRATTSALNAQLQWGTPELGGGAGYDRRRLGSLGAPSQISEALRLRLGWEVEGGNRFGLSLSRSDRRDERRAAEDLKTIDALLTARYQPAPALDFTYSLRYTNPVDDIRRTEAHDLFQNGRVAYATSFLERRGSMSAAYSLAARHARTYFAVGGELATPLTPLAGLSAVETFPATAERIQLTPNGGLVDGVTDSGGGSAVNIGYAPSVAGSREPRHVGVDLGLGPTREAVNTVYVRVDQPLPPELAALYGWTAWGSDDNLTWVPVALARPPAFDPFENRFELRIADTTARYVKVVTTPLPVGATLEQRFANVFVTELQVARLEAVPVGRKTSTAVNGAATVAGSYRIARPLAFDTSAFTAHGKDPLDVTWYLVNGLSYTEKLRRNVGLSARLQRSDADRGTGHETQMTFSTALNAELLPTLRAGAAYAGQISWFEAGRSHSNSVSALATADLYEGVSLAGNTAYTIGRISGLSTAALTANTGLTLQPHPRLSGTLGYGLVRSRSGDAWSPTLHRASASASCNPIGSVYASGSVSRAFGGNFPNTSVAVGLAWSPLAESALRLSLSYGQSLETASESTTRTFGSGLRWTLRPRTYLDASYSRSTQDSRVQEGSGHSFNVGLVVGM